MSFSQDVQNRVNEKLASAVNNLLKKQTAEMAGRTVEKTRKALGPVGTLKGKVTPKHLSMEAFEAEKAQKASEKAPNIVDRALQYLFGAGKTAAINLNLARPTLVKPSAISSAAIGGQVSDAVRRNIGIGQTDLSGLYFDRIRNLGAGDFIRGGRTQMADDLARSLGELKGPHLTWKDRLLRSLGL